MESTKTIFVDKKWDASIERFSIKQLELAVPKAMLRFAREQAARAKREVTRADLHCAYREPNGEINLNAISAALAGLGKLKGPSSEMKASARGELESYRTKARTALGLDKGRQKGANKAMASLIDEFEQTWQNSLTYQEADFEPQPASAQYAEPDFDFEDQTSSPTMITNSIGVSPQRQVRDLVAALQRASQIPSDDGVLIDYNTQMLSNEQFANTLYRFAATPEGQEHFGNIEANLRAIMLASADGNPVRKLDLIKGAVETDFRALPNYRKLGVDREAGEATDAEILRIAKGQTKYDGSAVTKKDFFSTGALLANIDVISQFQAFIPPVEIERLGAMLRMRAKKSDENHSRQVNSGHFTIVDPKTGSDPDCKMHVDHPLLGKTSYMALIARLLFPIQEHDANQIAAVESARRGRFQNLSIAFGYASVACALCGEMTVNSVTKSNGFITGFNVDPDQNLEMFADCDDDEDSYYYRRSAGIIRAKANTEGGFVYRNISILNVTEDGLVQIDPIPDGVAEIKNGSTFLISMDRFFSFFGGGLSYCPYHGMSGMYMRDGRRCMGMFANARAFINTAIVDAGAINDARIVLHPDVDY